MIKSAIKYGNEYILIFKNVPVKCILDQRYYNDETSKQILSDLKVICEEIQIDKSYVNSPDNKYKNTFIKEDGWEFLKRLIKKTKFGKTKLTSIQRKTLIKLYSAMIIEYIKLFFYQLNYDIDGMQFELSDESPLNIEYKLDTLLEWKIKTTD